MMVACIMDIGQRELNMMMMMMMTLCVRLTIFEITLESKV